MKLYKKPSRGIYVISIPVAFTRRDVVKKLSRWKQLKQGMLDNVVAAYKLALDQAEKDIYDKK